jgi:dihydroxycyclohexadiene carboxylate dehydrogenase
MIFSGRFEGKVLVVTGAAQGLGEAVATRAAREGGAVALVDRSEIVYEVAEKLSSEGAETLGLVTDLERYLGASTAMVAARNHFGRIDILVNNVGGTIWARPYAHYTEQQIEAEIRRSLFPTMWCCRAVLPFMVEQRRGTIVNVSSVATRGLNRAPYAAAKGGVNALTASLAWEYADHGIRVVATAPGGIEAPPRKVSRGTPQPQSDQEKAWFQAHIDQTLTSSLMHRYGTLDEEVAPILFLASDEASYITGSRLPVAGGDPG